MRGRRRKIDGVSETEEKEKGVSKWRKRKKTGVSAEGKNQEGGGRNCAAGEEEMKQGKSKRGVDGRRYWGGRE